MNHRSTSMTKTDVDYRQYQTFVDEKSNVIARAIQGVDALIADCSYTEQEYPAKKGWGHGTYHSSIQYAKRPGPRDCFAPTTNPPVAPTPWRRSFRRCWRTTHARLVTPTTGWPAKAKPTSSDHRVKIDCGLTLRAVRR